MYILINEAMPGYIKVGFTEAGLIDRIKGLDNTSLPLPFECFYAAQVEDSKRVERLLHDAFADQRVRNNREFFEVDPERKESSRRSRLQRVWR
ncbi:MAG: GIY-YIG nuclease family protein [Nitrospinota bacterium]